jgi:putative transposase
VPTKLKKETRALARLMAIPLRHSDPAKIGAAARTFFVTSSILGKRHMLQSHRSARLFIEVLYHYRAEQKYLLHDFVVMPDHFHALITLGSEMSVERAVQFIKGGFAFRAGKELGFRSPIWERGFSEVRIHDVEHFLQVNQYIVKNPVKRGMVENPFDYPYSSAHAGFQLDAKPQGLKPAA